MRADADQRLLRTQHPQGLGQAGQHADDALRRSRYTQGRALREDDVEAPSPVCGADGGDVGTVRSLGHLIEADRWRRIPAGAQPQEQSAENEEAGWKRNHPAAYRRGRASSPQGRVIEDRGPVEPSSG